MTKKVDMKHPDLKDFSPSNIWRMKQFLETCRNKPKLAPLVRELTWANNIIIMSRAKTEEARPTGKAG